MINERDSIFHFSLRDDFLLINQSSFSNKGNEILFLISNNKNLFLTIEFSFLSSMRLEPIFTQSSSRQSIPFSSFYSSWSIFTYPMTTNCNNNSRRKWSTRWSMSDSLCLWCWFGWSRSNHLDRWLWQSPFWYQLLSSNNTCQWICPCLW